MTYWRLNNWKVLKTDLQLMKFCVSCGADNTLTIKVFLSGFCIAK